jgi:hypothetical protein
MRASVWKIACVGLLATSLASQGCLVPWAKYIKVKRQLDECQKELSEKDIVLSDLQTRIDGLRNQLTSKDQLIQLYEEKYKDAEAMAAKVRAELDQAQGRLDKFAREHPGAEWDPTTGTLRLANTLLFETGPASRLDLEGLLGGKYSTWSWRIRRVLPQLDVYLYKDGKPGSPEKVYYPSGDQYERNFSVEDGKIVGCKQGGMCQFCTRVFSILTECPLRFSTSWKFPVREI